MFLEFIKDFLMSIAQDLFEDFMRWLYPQPEIPQTQEVKLYRCALGPSQSNEQNLERLKEGDIYYCQLYDLHLINQLGVDLIKALFCNPCLKKIEFNDVQLDTLSWKQFISEIKNSACLETLIFEGTDIPEHLKNDLIEALKQSTVQYIAINGKLMTNDEFIADFDKNYLSEYSEKDVILEDNGYGANAPTEMEGILDKEISTQNLLAYSRIKNASDTRVNRRISMESNNNGSIYPRQRL